MSSSLPFFPFPLLRFVGFLDARLFPTGFCLCIAGKQAGASIQFCEVEFWLVAGASNMDLLTEWILELLWISVVILERGASGAAFMDLLGDWSSSIDFVMSEADVWSFFGFESMLDFFLLLGFFVHALEVGPP